MKKIGLVIATEREYSVIFKNTEIKSELISLKPFEVHKLVMNDKEIFTIKAGIGEIYAAIATQFLIQQFKVELILNYGVVGSLRDDLELNNVVFIDKIFDYELDCTPLGEPRGFREDLNDTFVYPSKEILNKVKEYFPNIPPVTCASGNKFISKEEEKDALAKEFGADICEMEALGIALTAIKNSVPALFIKGVSDSKKGGAREFEKMIIESSESTFKVLTKITEIL